MYYNQLYKQKAFKSFGNFIISCLVFVVLQIKFFNKLITPINYKGIFALEKM